MCQKFAEICLNLGQLAEQIENATFSAVAVVLAATQLQKLLERSGFAGSFVGFANLCKSIKFIQFKLQVPDVSQIHV